MIEMISGITKYIHNNNVEKQINYFNLKLILKLTIKLGKLKNQAVFYLVSVLKINCKLPLLRILLKTLS
jgi:hypothetical protein